jgi:transcriptional regulator with PAS, ATPase and Fis domain
MDRLLGGALPSRARHVLLVIGEQTTKTCALPTEGKVSIGRSAENTVCVDDAAVSRRHAVLHVAETMLIEDLGSANGTYLSRARLFTQASGDEARTAEVVDRRLEPGARVPLTPEAVIKVGSTTLVVQSRREDPVVVVNDPAMQRLYALAERVAGSIISVLVLGETGVGKEVLAETIHRLSPRSEGPFLRLNCASLPESLLESELFGHERGAFTGAVQAKPGLLESAHGGTVFLDEIGEVAPATQARLLRVLEERQVMRIGALRPRTIDVRFIAATNRDLEHEVARGAFREDLYFRLSGITLLVPPLRDRPSEIEPLARTLIAHVCQKSGRDEQPDIADEALAMLRTYGWPGNVRELRNVMERAVLLCGRGPVTREHLPVEKMGETVPPPAPTTPDLDGTGVRAAAALRHGVETAERSLIRQALERCAGNQTQAAKLLGISRRTLVSRLAEYGIPRPRKRA